MTTIATSTISTAVMDPLGLVHTRPTDPNPKSLADFGTHYFT